MQPRSGGDVSSHNYHKPDLPSTSLPTSYLPTEHFHPTSCGSVTHQDYTEDECGTVRILVSAAHLHCVADLGVTHCIPFTVNVSQYNTVTYPPEQSVRRAQQGFQTLIYDHHHPVNHPPSPYQAHNNYLLGPYVIDSMATAPPQLTTSNPSVFYEQVDQNQRSSITAEVSAIQSPTSPQALGLPPSPVVSMNQAPGSASYRQTENGPRRILAVPIQSLSITDPTMCEIVAAFEIASWMLHQLEEPSHAGKSCYFQLIDESMMVCRLCGKQERRAERLVSHLRGHFDHRPYPCGDQCGTIDWYDPY